MEEPKPPLLLILLPLLLSYSILPISCLSPSPLPSPAIGSSPLPSPAKGFSPLPSPTKGSSPLPSPTKGSSSPPPSSSSTLDPKQLTALQSLNIPTARDPCIHPSSNNATICDSSKPFRHLLSLRLSNCSDDVQISSTALKSLSTLHSLSFFNCPHISPLPRLPADLAGNLRSFTCISSIRRLTGVWLSHLQNLTELTVSAVPITASGPSVIISSMKKINSVTVSHANLTGFLPKRWHANITHVDFSGNRIKGRIAGSLTELQYLTFLNLSSNQISGEIPDSFGDLISLQNVSLSSNSLSGPIPDSLAAIPSLTHLDLSSNQLNGTIPRFLSELRRLKYLNLANNNFQGVIPFNESTIKKLVVFRVEGNSNLCYNHSMVSSKLKLGIAKCDKDGFPVQAPPDKSSSADSSVGSGDDSSDGGDTGDEKPKESHHGPNKLVLGVAIGLSSIVFLIIFLVLLSKWCS